MSIELHESQNYMWNVHCDVDCLGEGSFGRVYRGIHKKTGAKVAIKTFKHANPQISQETKMLQSLRHQYIIQLLAIERDDLGGNTVMILELCNGGSLMSFLNEPANVCGLVDDEFLLVLEHLSGGLKYLKMHNVIHRDVKPDNIIRHVTDDGHTIYKLADFGAARELPEGENYSSLHGTEPYLNPDLYRAHLFHDPPMSRNFGPDTDHWSIGVTLYQITTGHLPFYVQDRRIMLRIYEEMKKMPGIIAASQKPNSEEIVYQSKLPQNCRLSSGLKQMIIPLIAGLFVQNSNERWSFAQFYAEQSALVGSKLIVVFFVNKMQTLRVYLKSDETFTDFKFYVGQQSEVSEENQMFLYGQRFFINDFDDFPPSDGGTVFLFDKSTDDVNPAPDIHLHFDKLTNFLTYFTSNLNIDNLGSLAVVKRDLCLCKNLMEYQSDAYKLTVSFSKHFKRYCKDEMKEQRKTYDNLKDKSTSIMSKIRILEKVQDMSELREEFGTATGKFADDVSYLFDEDEEQELSIDESHDSCLSTVLKQLTEIKPISKNLYRADRNKRLYDFEKTKLVHCIQTIMQLFVNKMDPNFDIFVNSVKKWYKNDFITRLQVLRSLKTKLNRYKFELSRFDSQVCQIAESMAEPTNKKSINIQKLLETLSHYKQNNVVIKSIIDENFSLVDKMNELLLNLATEV